MAENEESQIVKTKKSTHSGRAEPTTDIPPRTKRKVKRAKPSSGEDNPNFNNSNGIAGVEDESSPNRHSRSQLVGVASDDSGAAKPRRKRSGRGTRGSAHSIRSSNELDQTGLSATSLRSKQSGTSTRTKKTKRKRLRSPVSGKIESLGVDIADIQDDIMDASTDPDSEQDNKAHQHMMRSQPVGKLYVEQSNGFKATDKAAMEEMYEGQRSRETDIDEMTFPVKTTGMAFAVQTVHAFKTFTHFCMGCLAGFAVWQTIYAYILTSNPSVLDSILDLYQYSSIPINSVFYILLVFTAVATFDRYDIAKLNRQFLLRAFTLQSGAIACILYTAALCINVSLAPLDDRLGVRINTTSDSSREFTSKEERDSHLMSWKVLTIVRAVLVTLAWFIIAIRPGTNRLIKNLGHSEVTWANSSEQDHDITPAPTDKQQIKV